MPRLPYIRCSFTHWIHHVLRMQHKHRSTGVMDDFGNLQLVRNDRARYSLSLSLP